MEIQEKNDDKINQICIDNDKDNEETLYDESITSVILNESDVFGTLTIKNSTNNTLNNKDNNDNKKKNDKNENNHNINDNKEKNNHNNNEEKNINTMNIRNIYINSNCRETISANYIDNVHMENKNNQKEIELGNKKIEEMNTININKNKGNNNNMYFKSYYSKTIAGKNYGVVKINQDMPVAVININGIIGFNIFGVLDGHGVNGHHVSKFISEYLINRIINLKEISKIEDLDTIYQILVKSNYELINNIFLESDIVLKKQKFDISLSGTTCVIVIQVGKKIICANVGDSRAILIFDKLNDKKLKNTEVFELSHDCKPDLTEEKKRIEDNGGTVDQMLGMNGVRAGPQRVWAKNQNYPGLAMSRSLGDLKGKECGIIAIPDIIEYKLDERSKYMVICSDGVWEFLTNEDVSEIGNKYYLKNNIVGFTKELIQISENFWIKKDVIVDDITAVIVFF